MAADRRAQVYVIAERLTDVFLLKFMWRKEDITTHLQNLRRGDKKVEISVHYRNVECACIGFDFSRRNEALEVWPQTNNHAHILDSYRFIMEFMYI